MESHETAQPSVTGYLIVLVGVVGWVVGCFLPLYGVPGFGDRFTLYSQVSLGSIWGDIGGILYLFGAVSAILVISILGVLRVIRSGTKFLLVGAVVAWSLVSIGVLVSLAANLGGFSTDVTLGVGYWCCVVSVIVVIVGTAVVAAAERRREAETGGVTPPVEVS